MRNNIESQIESGIVLCATSKECLDLAKTFIATIRERNGLEAPAINLVTTRELYYQAHLAGSDFVQVHPRPNRTWKDKIGALTCSPFKITAMIDVDMIAAEAFAIDLFRSALYNPITALPGMGFNESWETLQYTPALSQFNTGCLVFNSYKLDLRSFTDAWLFNYDHYGGYGDQPAFRKTILDAHIQVGALSAEFNSIPNSFHNSMPKLLHFTGPLKILMTSKNWQPVISQYASIFHDKRAIGALSLDHKVLIYWDQEGQIIGLP